MGEWITYGHHGEEMGRDVIEPWRTVDDRGFGRLKRSEVRALRQILARMFVINSREIRNEIESARKAYPKDHDIIEKIIKIAKRDADLAIVPKTGPEAPPERSPITIPHQIGDDRRRKGESHSDKPARVEALPQQAEPELPAVVSRDCLPVLSPVLEEIFRLAGVTRMTEQEMVNLWCFGLQMDSPGRVRDIARKAEASGALAVENGYYAMKERVPA